MLNCVAIVFDNNSPSKENRIGQAFLRNYWFEIDANNQTLTLIEVNDVAIKKQPAGTRKRKQ